MNIQGLPDKDAENSSNFSCNVNSTLTEKVSYNTKNDSYYAATAYTGRPAHTNYFAKPNDNKEYVRNTYRRLSNIPEIIGDDYIAGEPPSMFFLHPEKTSNKHFMPLPKTALDRAHNAYRIEYFGSGYNWASWFYFIAILGYVFCTFGAGITLIGVILFGYIAGIYSTWSGFFQTILSVFGMAAVGFLTWKFFSWTAKKLPDKKHLKLNRQTGMVCFPRPGKKSDIEIPFSEFEPRYYIGAGTASFFYRLTYVHKSGKPVFYGGENTIGDVYTKAAYLEQFMDITKPLPDLPNLEWCRDKDPTTAVHDKATNRDPNYWRDMPYEKMKAIVAERRKKIENIFGNDAFKS